LPQLGHKAKEILSGQKRVTIYVRAGPGSAGPSKKTTKKTASKPVARFASAKTKKSIVQEKKISLYQSDIDYLGSFSDEDEFDPYIPTIDEEDDIVEASSPKPKAWPPVRSMQERAAPLRPSPSIEVEDDCGDVSMSDNDRLLSMLRALRCQASGCHRNSNVVMLIVLQIIARDRLACDDDVFDEMFLHRLSLTPPSGSC
jgi:hypothetical protein